MLSAVREFKHHTKTYLGRKCIYVLIHTQAEFLSNLIVEEQPGVEGGGEGEGGGVVVRTQKNSHSTMLFEQFACYALTENSK